MLTWCEYAATVENHWSNPVSSHRWRLRSRWQDLSLFCDEKQLLISTKLCKAHPSTLSHLILRTNLRFKEQEALLSLLHTRKSGGSGNLSHAPSLLFSKRELRLMCQSFESSPLTTDVNYTTYIFIFILAQKSYLLSVSLDMEPCLPSAEHFEICLHKADDALWSP